MQNLCTKLFFYIFFMLFSFSNIYSTNLKLKELLDIKGVTIKSYNKVNDVAVIEYIVRAKEAFDGILKISAPNSVSDIDLKLITKNINLSKQGSEDNTVSIKLTDSEISYVSFDISVPTAPEGYKQNYYRYFKIKKTDNDISILDPREKSNLKPKEVGKDITLVSGNSNLLLSMNYNINISGRIIIDPIGGNGKGLYGNGVALWFRNSSTPGTWYHPIATHQINVNYDILDEQGNFNFNFSFTGDLSAYNQAIVIVNTANDAAYLPAPADGYISWGPNGYTNYFNESQGVVANINGSSSNIVVNQNGIINKEDGSIPRYLELAREFVIQRYAGSLPFTIAPVKTYNSNLPSGIAGQFSVDWNLNDGWFNYITIDPDYSEISTITHEYGHYIHLTMWNNEMLNWATKDENLAEGWAIFYCFAARNYINKIYGDDIYVVQYNDDNTEYAPFRPGLRYGNIRYAQGGEPMKAAISCYLWGLYDSYSGGNFEITNYNNGDNDDLSGYSNTVFESMRSLSNSFFNTITNFENEFKIRIPTESRSSVVDVNFFMFSDLTSIPSHKMRSSQITNPALSNISQSQMRISWTPQNYSSYYIEINSPSEYRIYKNVSGSWQSVASAPYGTNNSDITISSGQYKFTAYNSSGDSYGAIVKQIFTVSLPTAQYIETGSGGSYKVNGTNIGSSWNGGYLEGSSPITLEAVPPTGFRFLTWSDGNTTNPRTITPSGNMTLSATFKAHLLSGVTTGLSTTSQRKIVADSYNYLHMVYESMGSIWYCRSTDAGATWSAEQKVNIAGSNAKCPSIACSNDGLDLIYITYQSGGDLPSIDLAQYQFGSLRWRNLVDYISSYSYNANPVVTALNGYAFVIHKPTSTSAFTGKEFAINTSYNVSAVYSRGNVPNTDANSTSPSLTVYGSGGGKYYLAYQQGTTEVKYFGWGINSAYGSQESATISTGSGA
ncbi:MAG: hypothetical protein NTX22_08895, partial [Ignavibacteriales bacterium]|nr:hypothetical protein [Ignavibacteriales bacterium]